MKRATKQTRKRKGDSPPCHRCSARCCRYLAIEIDTPRTAADYDDIRWYLLHRKVGVFIDHDGIWHLEFRSKCEALREDNRCAIYDQRPRICRQHGEENICEYHASPYAAYLRTVEDLEKYRREKKRKKRRSRARRSSDD